VSAGVEAGPVLTVALNVTERALVVRAVEALVDREGASPAATAVLEMTAGALDLVELAGLAGSA
jgi:hypothetical protein